MSLLDLFFVCSGAGILIGAFRILKKESFLWWHFWLFFAVGIFVMTFTFLPELRYSVGTFFGVERGADALVYVSIVVLFFLMLTVLQKIEKQRRDMSKLVRELALKTAEKNEK